VDGPLEVAPCLGDDVTVGGHAVLIGPIEIGDRVKISFSARVAEDVPSDVVVISRSVRNRVVPNGTGSENVAIEGAV
jgi:serine acetyltransferase